MEEEDSDDCQTEESLSTPQDSPAHLDENDGVFCSISNLSEQLSFGQEHPPMEVSRWSVAHGQNPLTQRFPGSQRSYHPSIDSSGSSLISPMMSFRSTLSLNEGSVSTGKGAAKTQPATQPGRLYSASVTETSAQLLEVSRVQRELLDMQSVGQLQYAPMKNMPWLPSSSSTPGPGYYGQSEMWNRKSYNKYGLGAMSTQERPCNSQVEKETLEDTVTHPAPAAKLPQESPQPRRKKSTKSAVVPKPRKVPTIPQLEPLQTSSLTRREDSVATSKSTSQNWKRPITKAERREREEFHESVRKWMKLRQLEQREKMVQPSVKSNRPYIDPSNAPKDRLSKLRTFPGMDAKLNRHRKTKSKDHQSSIDTSVVSDVDVESQQKELGTFSKDSGQQTTTQISEHDSSCATAPLASDRGGSVEGSISQLHSPIGSRRMQASQRSPEMLLEQVSENSSLDSESWITDVSDMAGVGSPMHSSYDDPVLNSFPSYLFGDSTVSDSPNKSQKNNASRVEALSRASVKKQTRRHVIQQFENPRAHGLAVPYRDDSSSPELAEASTESTFQLGLKGRSLESRNKALGALESGPPARFRQTLTKHRKPPKLQTVGAGFKILNPGFPSSKESKS